MLLQALNFLLKTDDFLVGFRDFPFEFMNLILLGEWDGNVCVKKLKGKKDSTGWVQVALTKINKETSKGFSGWRSCIFARTFVKESRTPCLARNWRNSSLDMSIGFKNHGETKHNFSMNNLEPEINSHLETHADYNNGTVDGEKEYGDLESYLIRALIAWICNVLDESCWNFETLSLPSKAFVQIIGVKAKAHVFFWGQTNDIPIVHSLAPQTGSEAWWLSPRPAC